MGNRLLTATFGLVPTTLTRSRDCATTLSRSRERGNALSSVEEERESFRARLANHDERRNRSFDSLTSTFDFNPGKGGDANYTN